MILHFLIGAALYVLSVMLLYSFKTHQYYYGIGLTLAFITNSLWLYIAKHSDGSNLYTRGLIWDSIIVGAYTLIPPLVYGVKLNPISIVGCVLIVIGIILTKV